jgi:putative thioredoxin
VTAPVVIDVSAATFGREVIEASHRVPVIVDFWAPWCAPCRTLGPLLERLAAEYGGRFVLAKVNSDENAELAREYALRSIPDVRAFSKGAVVDGFLGVLPERQLRAFLDRVAPPPAEVERRQAMALRAAGDREGALAALRRAVALDPQHVLARIDLAEALILGGDALAAEGLLADVPQNIDWDPRVAALRQGIAFQHTGGNVEDLAARVAGDPGDLESRLALAAVHAGQRRWREALDELLEIIRRDKAWRDGEARRQMLAIFNLAADDPALVSDYRRKLASALH